MEAGAHLLERGSFKIGEVAVEVGFETPEAFSKAFRSAYGQSPKAFQKCANRTVRLPSASGIHFHPSGLIVRRQGDKKMKLSDIMVRHHVDETTTILNAIATLDEDAIDEPLLSATNEIPWDSYEPSLRGVMRAIVATEAIWVAALEGEPFPEIDKAPSVSALTELHRTSGDRLVALVADFEAKDLWGSEFVDALCAEPTRFEFGGVIAHILTFSAYRRLKAIAALGKLGIDTSAIGDPIHWVRKQRGEAPHVTSCG